MAGLTTVERWNRDNWLHRLIFDQNMLVGVESHFYKAIEVAGEIAMLYWWKEILPEHFERPAHGRYKYHARKPWYIRYKTRRWPESRGLDLVRSGFLKEIATSRPRSKPRVIRRTWGFELRIGVRTTRYVMLNKYVNMHREITEKDTQDVLRIWDVFSKVVTLNM